MTEPRQILLRRLVIAGLFASVFWGSFFPAQNMLMYIGNAVITVVLFVIMLAMRVGSDMFLLVVGWILLGAGVILTLNLAVGNTAIDGWPTPVRLAVYALLVCFYLHLLRAIRKATRPPWVRYVVG
ncbi:MAG: hypothetical protein RI947_652 [Candidatus Parcubacteria bacterium]